MKTVSFETATQQFDQILDDARTSPVCITRNENSAFVLTSHEDYNSLLRLKFERLKHEVQLGFDQLDRGEVSKKTIGEILVEAKSKFEQGLLY